MKNRVAFSAYGVVAFCIMRYKRKENCSSPSCRVQATDECEKVMNAPQGETEFPLPHTEMQFVRTEEGNPCNVIYLTGDSVGETDSVHARRLIRTLLCTLTETAPLPEVIILINTAVKLALPGSAVLESLVLLQKEGVRIILAQDSAAVLGKGEKVAVGKWVTMHEILHTLIHADKVIPL